MEADSRRRVADNIAPVSVPRLSEEVAERIRRLIVSEQLAEGARLPPERDLAERFAVSRPMVSQALRMLSLMGLVEIRRGSGAYVLRRPQSMVTASVNLMLDLDQGPIDDLAELRLWLEKLGVVHAAQRPPAAGAAADAAIEHALRRLADASGMAHADRAVPARAVSPRAVPARAVSPRATSAAGASAWIAADTVFHAAAVAAAGNPYLTAVYESVHTAVLSYEHDQWVRTDTEPSWLDPANAPALVGLHQAIHDAVAARDADAAQAAVVRHHEVMLQHLAAGRDLPASG